MKLSISGPRAPTNPAEELALLKQKVGELGNRVADLERSADRNALQNSLVFLLLVGYGAFKAFRTIVLK